MEVIRYISLINYTLTFIIGLAGNTLVLHVVRKYPSRQRNGKMNIFSCYIWNLALADELFILTSPLFGWVTYTNDWIFSEPVCKLAWIFYEGNRFASAFLLSALSICRYLGVVTPHGNPNPLGTFRSAVVSCVLIWVLSMAFVSPHGYYARVNESSPNATANGSTETNWSATCAPYGYDDIVVPPRPRTFNGLHHTCQQEFPPELSAVWVYIQTVVGLLVPFLIIAVSNGRLLWHTRRISRYMTNRMSSSANIQPGRDSVATQETATTSVSESTTMNGPRGSNFALTSQTEPRPPTTSSSRKRAREQEMTRLLLAMTIMFLFFQTPFYVNNIVQHILITKMQTPGEYGLSWQCFGMQHQTLFAYSLIVATILMFASSCCNPFLYGVLNRNYSKYEQSIPSKRKSFVSILEGLMS